MRMDVDEAWRNHVPADVDHTTAGERFSGDARDPAPCNPHVAHGVESGFGIQHAAAGKHDVMALCGCAVTPCADGERPGGACSRAQEVTARWRHTIGHPP